MFAFQLKMLKAKNTALNRQRIWKRSYTTKVLELSEKEYIITMVNILRAVIENRQQTRMSQYKQRDGNSEKKKSQKKMLKI